MEGALQGIRVIELADAQAEWLGKLLADLGAEVIKVEPPGGASSRTVGPFVDDVASPERSLFFWHYNTSKKSVTLDIETAAGLSTLKRLLATADVFIETFAPGHAQAYGLDYARLSATNPRLVQVAVTPFGQTGPYVDAGYVSSDLVTMALGGPMQSCGYDAEDDLPPVRPGPYHSYHTASHYGCIAVLAALWGREATGRGDYLDVSAQATLAITTEGANLQWEYAGGIVRRQTGRHASVMATANSQQVCADGRPINFMMIRDEASTQKILDYLHAEGLGDLVDESIFNDPARIAERGGALINALELITAVKPADEVMHAGQTMGFTWGAVRAPEEWLDDPHGIAREMVVQVEHPELGRSVTYPGAPMKLSASPWRISRRAPLIGEDNDEVLGAMEGDRTNGEHRGAEPSP